MAVSMEQACLERAFSLLRSAGAASICGRHSIDMGRARPPDGRVYCLFLTSAGYARGTTSPVS
jgi:hypothetical protein